MTELENNVNIQTWKDFITDPGFVSIVGFITLLVGGILCMLDHAIIPIYGAFSLGVVGLVGGHAWTDSQKTKYVCENEKNG